MPTHLEASDDGGVLLGPWTRVVLPLPPVVETAAGYPQFRSSLFPFAAWPVHVSRRWWRGQAATGPTGITPCPVTSEWNAYAPKSKSRRVVPYTKKAVPKAIKPSAMSIHMGIEV